MTALASNSFAVTEEPDLVIGRYIGHVSSDDLRRLLDVQRVFCEGKPHVFLIADLHRMTHISAEARRVAAEPVVSATRTQGIAVIGASFHFRVLTNMLFKAAKILRHLSDVPVRFFETESEARAWFDEIRRELGLSLVKSNIVVDDGALENGSRSG